MIDVCGACVEMNASFLRYICLPECERIEHSAEVERALAAAFERVRFVEAAVRDRVDNGRAGLSRERKRERRDVQIGVNAMECREI